MGDKKFILIERVHSSMVDGDPDSISQRERISLDYRIFLDMNTTGDVYFDAFLAELSSEMQVYDSIDPYSRSALTPLTSKADAFLRVNAGISYNEFLRRSEPEKFVSGGYEKLPEKRNLKRRLFEHRTRLYLASLYDCERKGYDLDCVLRAVKLGTIQHMKRESEDPTFQEILRILDKAY